MLVWSLSGEDLLEEGGTTHSKILAWRISWTEEPGGLQSIGSHRVGHDWSDSAHTQDSCSVGSSVHWRIFSSIQVSVAFPNLWQSKMSPENDKCDLRGQNDSWLRIHVRQIILVAVQSLSHVQLFATPWTAARQTSLSFTISQSLLRLMSIESVIPSNHLVLCYRYRVP